MKKIRNRIIVIAIIAVAAFNVYVNNSMQEGKFSELSLANIKALSQIEGGESSGEGGEGGFRIGDVPWYDFIDNYWGETTRIEVDTKNCRGGSLSYKGATLSIGSCTQYTAVLYTPCFDGRDANQCTSDKKTYI